MAQNPSKRHVLASVRLTIGLLQSELAAILGYSSVTVQRIEQGTLSMSETLAVKAEKELGVSADWLLANDPTQPAVTPGGGRWDKDIYESTQGQRFKYHQILRELEAADAEAAANEFIDLRANEFRDRILVMLQRTKRLPKQGILLHRLNKALNEMEEDFNPDNRTLEKPPAETENAKKAYHKTVERITQREKKRLWSDEPEK
jgi:transcriptional regulator with XRE-family HTH domain